MNQTCVTVFDQPGPIPHMANSGQRKKGMSLIELLCVIAIILILAAMYLGSISKAFIHVKKVLGN